MSPSRLYTHTCVRARTPVLSLSPSQNTSSRLSSASAQRPPRTQTITTNSWRCLLWVTVDWEEKPPGLLDSIHSHQSCSITLSVYLVPALHADPSGGCFPVWLAWLLFKYLPGSGFENRLCKHCTASANSGIEYLAAQRQQRQQKQVNCQSHTLMQWPANWKLSNICVCAWGGGVVGLIFLFYHPQTFLDFSQYCRLLVNSPPFCPDQG